METLIPEISRLLGETLSPDQTLVSSTSGGLDRLSKLPHFPFSLLAIAKGSDNQGLRIAATTYLKNFTRRHMEAKPSSPELHIEFRNQLAQALLQAEPALLKVLIEAYFLNPKMPKEPVPLQLELIAEAILVPLQASFQHFVDKALSCKDDLQTEIEHVLLIICKCMYFTVNAKHHSQCYQNSQDES